MPDSVPSETLVRSRNRRRVDQRRKGTEDAALKIFGQYTEGLPISQAQRTRCHGRIRSAKRPTATARKLAQRIRSNAASAAQELDLSDIQELRVELIRKHGANAQAFEVKLKELDKAVVRKNLTKQQLVKARRNLLRRR